MLHRTPLLLLALAALAAAALPAPAAAQAPCAPGLTPEQCKVCALSAAPAKCHACIAAAKPSSAAAMTALTCMVCGSLAGAAQQDTCSACVKTHGYNAGCSTCAGAALFGLAANAKPTAQGLATASGCFGCYAKASPELQATPACSACWAPSSKDPTACSACVAGETGVPAGARAACFSCHLKASADAAGCSACLKGAKSTGAAMLCPLCAGGAGPAVQDQSKCFSCMDAVSPALPGVKWLCHLTGTAEGNKPTPALTAAVPRYFKCLAAAKTLEGGQGCRKCMDSLEKDAKAGDACFAALTV